MNLINDCQRNSMICRGKICIQVGAHIRFILFVVLKSQINSRREFGVASKA